MNQIRRGSLAAGLVLIGLGVWFGAVELFPALRAIAYGPRAWPLVVIGIGVGLMAIGLVTWTPGTMIPACLIAGVGGLLYWQNATGNWESWAYAWTLIPGFIGVGVILAELLHGRPAAALRGGGWLIVISLVLLAVFGAFLGGPQITPYWPVLLIVLGVLILAEQLIRSRR